MDPGTIHRILNDGAPMPDFFQAAPAVVRLADDSDHGAMAAEVFGAVMSYLRRIKLDG